jgi:hypothetical protein
VNAPRPLRSYREAKHAPPAELPLTATPKEEFLPRSALQDPDFCDRIKREAHLRRNEAIRDALSALARRVVGKMRG